MDIEWDSEKEAINIRKHGISFEIAKNIFFDDLRIEIYDEKHSIYEDRYNTIGLVEDVLFVVYTERKEKIRLISARLADKKERSLYYDSRENIV
ncbi:MAG: BrnT family toxin [Eubacterium sp.]|nr:BrnT family toxin [Eubacterium sp.]